MTENAEEQTPCRVMVDIETVGLDTGSAIVEIGAVVFDYRDLGDTFHRSVSLTSSQEHGLTVDADTVEWWLGENPEVAPEVLVGGDDLERALAQFGTWLREADADEVWANSPAFDLEQLEYAAEQVGIEMPWAFYEERDLRTLKAVPHGVDTDDIEHEGTEHTALNDAIHQAWVAAAILADLDGRAEVTA
jgi:hypothetical protein